MCSDQHLKPKTPEQEILDPQLTRQAARGAGKEQPTRRYCHASWAWRHYVYIFGGISLNKSNVERGNQQRRARVLSDLWRWDTVKEAWRELEPAGSRPCARALMGAPVLAPMQPFVASHCSNLPGRRKAVIWGSSHAVK